MRLDQTGPTDRWTGQRVQADHVEMDASTAKLSSHDRAELTAIFHQAPILFLPDVVIAYIVTACMVIALYSYGL